MALTHLQCGAVILAGGNSRRMGTCKALLPWQGSPLVCHIHRQLSGFDDVWLSANDPQIADVVSLPWGPDLYPDTGPLGGLHAALSATRKEYLLCVPCDLPNFHPELAELLLRSFPDGAQALVCRDSSGQIHPLCGIYSRSSLPVLTQQLDNHNLRVMAFLDQISYAVLDTSAYFPDNIFFNMNTMQDYQMLRHTI